MVRVRGPKKPTTLSPVRPADVIHRQFMRSCAVGNEGIHLWYRSSSGNPHRTAETHIEAMGTARPRAAAGAGQGPVHVTMPHMQRHVKESARAQLADRYPDLPERDSRSLIAVTVAPSDGIVGVGLMRVPTFYYVRHSSGSYSTRGESILYRVILLHASVRTW